MTTKEREKILRFRVKNDAPFHAGRVGSFVLSGKGLSEGVFVLKDDYESDEHKSVCFAVSANDVELYDGY